MSENQSEHKPTIMVVDDELAIRQTMTRFFERKGWKCISIADGATAETALFGGEVEPVDVILCDLRMPYRSGLELYERAAVENPDLASRFVLSSGDTIGVHVGCPVLAKPYPLSELEAVAMGILQQHHAA